MRRLFVLVSSFFAAHKVTAAAVVGVAGAQSAVMVGRDPFAWGIGLAGGAFVFLMREPTTRREAVGNSMLSLFLGGIGGQVLANLVVAQAPQYDVAGLDYLLCFVAAFAWPWVLTEGVPWLKQRFGVGGGNA